MISSAAALLSDLYNETGNKALAYDYLKEYYSINDSISNNEFLKKVTRLEIENEYNRRQEEADFEHRQELLIRENRISTEPLSERTYSSVSVTCCYHFFYIITPDESKI